MDEPRPPAAPAGTPPNLGNPRYLLFDSLRGLAALSVFAAHVLVFLIPLEGGSLKPALTRIDFGIAIFLLLSSFLLWRPYVQARYSGSRPPALIPYAIRRVVRIVPVYWVSLPLVALLLAEHDVLTPGGIVRYFGFLQIYDGRTIDRGIGQAWTICVEVTFYALLPAAAFVLRRIRFRTTRQFVATELGCLAVLFVVAVAWKLQFGRAPSVAGYGKLDPAVFVLPAYLDAFAIGMALAVLSVVLAHRDRQPSFVRLIDRAPWVPWIGAAIAYWASGLGGGRFALQSTGWYIVHQELNILVAVGLFLPAIFGDQTRGRLRRMLASRWLIWMGGISYGFYLWHLAILSKLRDLGWLEGTPGPVAFVAVGLAGSVVMGALSYYLLGRYAIRLGQRVPREGFAVHRRGLEAREPRHGEPDGLPAPAQAPAAETSVRS